MTRSEIEAMKMQMPEHDPVRLGDDPEREKAVMFVRGWNSAIECLSGTASIKPQQQEAAE